MQQLLADNNQQNKKISKSFLDIGGWDVNSKQLQSENLMYEITNNKQEIVCSDTVSPGSSIMIQLQQSQNIYYLGKMAILFNLNITDPLQFPLNLIDLFTNCSKLKIGNVEITNTQSSYLNKQFFSRLPMEYKHILKGLNCFKDNDFSFVSTTTANNEFLGIAADNAAFGKVDLFAHFKLQNKNAANNQYMVPLVLLYPQIAFLPDFGAIYLDMGQTIQMSFQIAQPSQCLSSVNAGSVNYSTFTLSNINLLKIYTKCSTTLSNLLMKSTVELPIVKFLQYPLTVVSQQLNMNFSISKNQTVKRLWMAYHWNIKGLKTDTLANNTGNLQFTQSPDSENTVFQNSNSMMLCPRITQLTINFAGNQLNLNQSTLSALHQCQGLISSLPPTNNTNPIGQALQSCFVLDMGRYIDDLYGSSVGDSVNMIYIQVQFDFARQILPLSSATFLPDFYKNFDLQAFLEVQEIAQFSQGQYSIVQ